MKSPYRALLWEQARTAGVICLLLGVLSGLSMLMVYYYYFTEAFATADLSQMGLSLMLTFSGIAASFLICRQDARGHITIGFNTHLLRLPVPLRLVFLLFVGARFVGLMLLLAFQTLFVLTLPEIDMGSSFYYMHLVLYLYLVAQAFSWVYKRAPIILVGTVALVFIGLWMPRFWGSTPDQTFILYGRVLRHPVFLAFVPPVSLALMSLGVWLERYDRYFGPQSLSNFVDNAWALVSPPLKKSKEPLDAQVWYEIRRSGWVLPVYTAGTTFFIVLLMTLLMDHPLRSGFGQYIPSLALLIAWPASAAMATYKSKSNFWTMRPATDSTVANARLLAQLRGLIMAMLIAGILSLFLLLAGPMERTLLYGLRDDGILLAFDVFVLVARPVTLAGLAVWVLLWGITFPMSMVALTLYIFFRGSLYFFPEIYQEDLVSMWLYGFVVLVFFESTIIIMYAQHKQTTSFRKLVGLGLVWIVLTSFIGLGSRSLEGAAGVLTAAAISMLLLLPVVSLPWHIRTLRHDIGVRRFFT